MKDNGKTGILITIKTGSGQGDPQCSILFLIAIKHLNRLLETAFMELIYTTEEDIVVGPLFYADDNLAPSSTRKGKPVMPYLVFL